MRHLWFRALIMLLLVCLTVSCRPNSDSEDQAGVLLITDIHFDPFRQAHLIAELDSRPWTEWEDIFAAGNDTIPMPGQTCGPKLLDSLRRNLVSAESAPDLLVFCGDILAHGFREKYVQATGRADEASVRSFILKTVNYVMSTVASAYPDRSLYFTLGNNDSYAGDYLLEDNGPFLSQTAEPLFDICIKNPDFKDEFMIDYPRHGCFAMNLPELDNVRLISLNTVFMSSNYPETNGTDPGTLVLDWLENELALCRAQNRTAWILTHIPLGVDVYAHLHRTDGKCSDPPLFLKKQYNQRLITILRSSAETVRVVLTGHTHMDDFRLVFPDKVQKNALASVLISPAVTPLFNQNPGFRVLNFQRENGLIRDMSTFFLSLPVTDQEAEWFEEYVFSRSLGQAPDTAGLEAYYAAIPKDESVRGGYIHQYSVGRRPSLITTAWPWYWCALGCLTPEDYLQSCPDCDPAMIHGQYSIQSPTRLSPKSLSREPATSGTDHL